MQTNETIDSRFMEHPMETKKLYNPAGNDALHARLMIDGNPTNIFNLNNVKFSWATKMYRIMMENFWIPEKVDLTKDNINALTEDEARAYKGILSFLIFLDSLQTNNIPNISKVVTAPEVNLVLAIQTYQEAIHSQSYQYILESIIPKEERDGVYDYWRTDNDLFVRNSVIADRFQEYLDNPRREGFKRVLIANYLLEGLYFYNAFNFFYTLASRSKMVGTADIIKYINRDELTHCTIFHNIIAEVMLPEDKPWIVEMFREAVAQEIRWSKYILGNNILGISYQSIEQYTMYLANRRLRYINIEPIFDAPMNPYSHLENIADVVAKGTSKSNFFEATVTGYNQSSSISGWDDF